MSGGFRCFVALTPPEGLQRSIAGFFGDAGPGAGAVRWVTPAALHLTLAFLGEVARDQLPAVSGALDAAAAGHAPFLLALHGAGVFPAARRPRVVWVGTGSGADATVALADCVARSLAPHGFTPDERPFTPHFTVGRVKSPPRDSGALPRLVAAVADRPWGDFMVHAVHLMRSELFPSGPIYSILHTARLSGIPRRPDEGADLDDSHERREREGP